MHIHPDQHPLPCVSDPKCSPSSFPYSHWPGGISWEGRRHYQDVWRLPLSFQGQSDVQGVSKFKGFQMEHAGTVNWAKRCYPFGFFKGCNGMIMTASAIFSSAIRLRTGWWRPLPMELTQWPLRRRRLAQNMIFWLVVWNMFFLFAHILGIMVPTDCHTFQRGSNHQVWFWMNPKKQINSELRIVYSLG